MDEKYLFSNLNLLAEAEPASPRGKQTPSFKKIQSQSNQQAHGGGADHIAPHAANDLEDSSDDEHIAQPGGGEGPPGQRFDV